MSKKASNNKKQIEIIKDFLKDIGESSEPASEEVTDYNKIPSTSEIHELVKSNEQKIKRWQKDNYLVYIVCGLVTLGRIIDTFFWNNYEMDYWYESKDILEEKIIIYENKIEILENNISQLEGKIDDKISAKVNQALLDYIIEK